MPLLKPTEMLEHVASSGAVKIELLVVSFQSTVRFNIAYVGLFVHVNMANVIRRLV